MSRGQISDPVTSSQEALRRCAVAEKVEYQHYGVAAAYIGVSRWSAVAPYDVVFVRGSSSSTGDRVWRIWVNDDLDDPSDRALMPSFRFSDNGVWMYGSISLLVCYEAGHAVMVSKKMLKKLRGYMQWGIPGENSVSGRVGVHYNHNASGDVVPSFSEDFCTICTGCSQLISRDGRSENGGGRCSKCKIAIYCSKECQKSHWKKVHKHICNMPL
jgi:hypothetical protein